MWEGTGVWGCQYHCVCVRVCVCLCMCVCVCVCFFACHTRKGARMLYIVYVEHTMGEVEATMGRCTSSWSP